jgi:acetylornithine deacetylase/succinyl-diaminopimelate desuccinylase-like protein
MVPMPPAADYSPAASLGLAGALAWLEADRPAALARLMEFLRIPSISAQPGHAADCVRAAEWARDALAGIGFNVTLRPTAGHPIVLAHHAGPPGWHGPRLLYYGHYDVQPPDPLALWTSPPFEPQVVDAPTGPRVVARGAVDDKGQVSLILEALRAWHASGGIPLPVTVLLEGEEEVGSANLAPFLESARDELAADVVVASDTNMWDRDTPAITTRLRGLLYAELTVHGPARDLHSGLFGGLAVNPINALTSVLGGLHDADGRVRLPGFYDAVRDISAEQAESWRGLGFNAAAFLNEIGLTVGAGERDRTPLERLWSRPTADINGIWGGYTGPGAKTVIAAQASAKVSFRLVPDQDPVSMLAAFREFITERLPAGARFELTANNSGGGIAMAEDSPVIAAARAALAEEYGRPAVLIGGGGSIPVVESFRRILGLDTLLMGFGLDDDRIHSPDEKFDLRCFHQGARAHARLIGRLAAG